MLFMRYTHYTLNKNFAEGIMGITVVGGIAYGTK